MNYPPQLQKETTFSEGGGEGVLQKRNYYPPQRPSTKVLGEVEGHLDVVPFDFSSLKGKGDFSSLEGISLSLGVTIKPYIFNEVMITIEPVLKLVISIALGLQVLRVEIAQRVLDVAVRVLEVVKTSG